jgi:hypothetical protein
MSSEAGDTGLSPMPDELPDEMPGTQASFSGPDRHIGP